MNEPTITAADTQEMRQTKPEKSVADQLKEQKLERQTRRTERISDRNTRATEKSNEATEAFRRGMAYLKTKTEGAVAGVVSLPEKGTNFLDRVSGGVADKLLDARAWKAEKQDQLAQSVDARLNKVVGSFDSWRSNNEADSVNARSEAAKAKANQIREKAQKLAEKNKAKADKLRQKAEKLTAQAQQIEETGEAENAFLEANAMEEDEMSNDLLNEVEKLRQEAEARRTNAKSLASLRRGLFNLIRA